MELQLQHKPAAHCENGTISNLLRFYGVEVSEPMAFGHGLWIVQWPVLCAFALRESGWYADDSIPHFPRFTL